MKLIGWYPVSLLVLFDYGLLTMRNVHGIDQSNIRENLSYFHLVLLCSKLKGFAFIAKNCVIQGCTAFVYTGSSSGRLLQ